MIFCNSREARLHAVEQGTNIVFKFVYKGDDGLRIEEFWVRDINRDEKVWTDNVAKFSHELFDNKSFIEMRRFDIRVDQSSI